MAIAISSTDEKKPRCASPTLVHTRTCGSAIETSRRISPNPLIPSSTTANSGAVCSSNSDSGRPRWLFRLPRLRNVVKRRASSVAEISLVVVLPALPVMATTVDDGAAPDHAGGLLQAMQRVVHHDHRHAGSRHRRRVADDDGTRAPRDGLGDEGVPVEAGTTNGHEQITGRHRPRVDRDRRQRAIARAELEVATERGRHLDGREGERRRAHRAPP